MKGEVALETNSGSAKSDGRAWAECGSRRNLDSSAAKAEFSACEESLNTVSDAGFEISNGLTIFAKHDEEALESSLVELFGLADLSNSIKDVMEGWLRCKALCVKKWLEVSNLGFESFDGLSNSNELLLSSDNGGFTFCWNSWDSLLDAGVSLKDFTENKSISVGLIETVSVVFESLVFFSEVGEESLNELVSLLFKSSDGWSVDGNKVKDVFFTVVAASLKVGLEPLEEGLFISDRLNEGFELGSD